MDPMLARSIYEEIEYLTRGDGVLFARFAVIADRVEAARDRLLASEARRIRCTRAKVSAVIGRLVDAGWMALARKTCRQAVFVVASPSWIEGADEPRPMATSDPRPPFPPPAAAARAAAQQEPLRNSTTRSPSGEPSVFKSENGSSLNSRGHAKGFAPQEQGARVLATRIVRDRAPKLACKGSSNAVGSWWRYIVAGLRHVRPSEQPVEAARYAAAIDALVARRGVASLSGVAVGRVWPSGPITPLSA